MQTILNRLMRTIHEAYVMCAGMRLHGTRNDKGVPAFLQCTRTDHSSLVNNSTMSSADSPCNIQGSGGKDDVGSAKPRIKTAHPVSLEKIMDSAAAGRH